jgi:hypothetical protein
MKPSEFSTIIVRFISIGLFFYGTIILVGGFINQRAISKQNTTIHELVGDLGGESSVGMGDDNDSSMVTTAYGFGVTSIIVSGLLLFSSRRIGLLVARGL